MAKKNEKAKATLRTKLMRLRNEVRTLKLGEQREREMFDALNFVEEMFNEETYSADDIKKSLGEVEKKIKAPAPAPAPVPAEKPAPEPKPDTPQETVAKVQNLEAGAAPKPEASKSTAKTPKQVNFENEFEPGSKGVYRYVRTTVRNPEGQLVTKEMVVRASTAKAAQSKAVAWARSQGADQPTQRLIYAPEQMDYTPNIQNASGPVRADQMAQEMSGRLQALRAKNKEAPELYTPIEKQAFEDRKKAPSDKPARKGSTTQRRPGTAGDIEGREIDEAGDAATRLRNQRILSARNDLKARITAAPDEWNAFVARRKGKAIEALTKEDSNALIEEMAVKMAEDPERLDDAGKQALERAKNNMQLVTKDKKPRTPNFELAYKSLVTVPATNVGEIVSKGRRGSKTRTVVNEARDYIDSAELKKLIGDKTGNEARAIRVKYLAETGAFDHVNQEGGRARILDIIDDPKSFAALSKDNNAMSVLEKYGKASVLASKSPNSYEYGRIVLSRIDYALKDGPEGAGQRLIEIDEKVRPQVLKTNGSLKKKFLGGTGPERTQRAILATMSMKQRNERLVKLESVSMEQLIKRYDGYSDELKKAMEKGANPDSREMRLLRARRSETLKDIALLSEVTEKATDRRFANRGTAIVNEWFQQQTLLEKLEEEADPAKKKVLQDQIDELGEKIAARESGIYKPRAETLSRLNNLSLKGRIGATKKELKLAEKGLYSRGRNRTGKLAEEAVPERIASLKKRLAELEGENLRRKDPALAATKAAEAKAAKAAEEAAMKAAVPVETPAAPATAATTDAAATAAAAAAPTGPKAKASALTSGAWKKGPGGAGRSDTAAKAVKGRAAAMGIGRGASVAAKMSPLMRVLGPLGMLYGAYELTSAMRERTIGDADRQRLRNLEALSAISGGVEQDMAGKEQLRQMRQFVDLAGIERQRQVDEMRKRYSDQTALDAILRGHEASLAALAQPSRPSIAEMMARM